jgi:hypothetical protein
LQPATINASSRPLANARQESPGVERGGAGIESVMVACFLRLKLLLGE